MKNHSGKILAMTVGMLFATATFAGTDSSHGNVKCMGANACKGKGACKGASNGCQGQNSCKGKSWIMTETEKECTDKGGKVDKG